MRVFFKYVSTFSGFWTEFLKIWTEFMNMDVIYYENRNFPEIQSRQKEVS